MVDQVAAHYSGEGSLAGQIAAGLQAAGKDTATLTTADLAAIDEFHIRGRTATLELAERMGLEQNSRVLDIGSGLGGPARTLAESFGCHVTGVDLTEAFCDAAREMSGWVGLRESVSFQQGDATNLMFEDDCFDAAMTIHVAMNIARKGKVYAHAKRVIRPGGIFAVYDVLQGEGGEVLFPVPWARKPSISHLATPKEMRALLSEAGFKIVDEHDSTEESQRWFEERLVALKQAGPPPLSFQLFLGDDFPAMTRNQVQNLTERRIRTVSFICMA